MNRYPWFRLYAEARTDAKLRTLNDAQFRVWFNLLCYASEQEERGTIPPTDPFLLAVEVASGDEELLAETLHRLAALRMISTTLAEGAVTFSKFTERQYDKPSDAPDATRERKARQRAKQREAGVTNEKSRPMSRDVTPSHAPEKIRVEEKIVEETIDPPNPPKGGKRERAKAKTTIPDDFAITDEMRAWADEKAPGVDIDVETERFLDRNRREGSSYADWPAAWRYWMTTDYPKAMKGNVHAIDTRRSGQAGRQAGYGHRRLKVGAAGSHGPGGYDSWADKD